MGTGSQMLAGGGLMDSVFSDRVKACAERFWKSADGKDLLADMSVRNLTGRLLLPEDRQRDADWNQARVHWERTDG